MATASPSRKAWPSRFGANLLQASGQFHNPRRAGAAQPGPRPPGDVRTGGQRLDATALPASAPVSVKVDGHVPALGGASRAAVVDLLVEHDARADARAERGVKNVGVPNPRAPKRFGQAGGVGIVVDARGNAEYPLHFGGQRVIAPAGHVGRIEHHPGLGVERAGRADSNTRHRAPRLGEFGKDRIHSVFHRRETRGRVSRGHHRRARLMGDLSARVHQPSGHFGAADVNANRHCFRHGSVSLGCC